MSRLIDHERPYSDDDKNYLLSRPGGEDLISVNDRKFSHLSDESRKKLLKRHESDEEKEKAIQQELEKQQKQAEEDSYHEDDVAQVQPLTIAQLRKRLEDEGLSSKVTKDDLVDPSDADNPFTEKEALAYRLLEHLDSKRRAQDPAESE